MESVDWEGVVNSIASRLKRAIQEWCESPYHTADDESDCFYSLISVPDVPDLMEMFKTEAGFTDEEIEMALRMPERYRRELDSEMFYFLSKKAEEWEGK